MKNKSTKPTTVDLIQSTPNAAELLIFSKKTRLSMTPKGFDDIVNMTDERKAEELKYVFGTIGSSWEFVDYVFLISGVTRAFTHQLVRHRVGVSFAQQTMRAVDMSAGFDWMASGACSEGETFERYSTIMKDIAFQYSEMVSAGAAPQDARGILPTNILTTILVKINLRSLSALLNTRLCYKAQGEFQTVAKEMRHCVLGVHPWAEPVLRVHCAQYGSCAFPGYADCPMKNLFPKLKADNEQLGKMARAHDAMQHEAKPKIKKEDAT